MFSHPSPRQETAQKVARTYYLLWIDRETAPSGRMPQRLFQQSRQGEGAADSYSFPRPNCSRGPRRQAMLKKLCRSVGSLRPGAGKHLKRLVGVAGLMVADAQS